MSVSNFTASIFPICKKCGANDRNKSGNCRPCARSTSLAWKRNNPEKIKASWLKYVDENKEAVKAQQAAWYERNKPRASANNAAWIKNNAERRQKYVLEWRSKNSARYEASVSAYHAKNKVRINIRLASYRRLNAEKIRTKNAIWSKLNPDKLKIYNHTRRARERNAIGVLSPGLSERLFALQKGLCPCCKRPLGALFHMDHIQPLALGGSNTDDNIQLLRKSCNHQKSFLHPVEFMQRRGFLL